MKKIVRFSTAGIVSASVLLSPMAGAFAQDASETTAPSAPAVVTPAADHELPTTPTPAVPAADQESPSTPAPATPAANEDAEPIGHNVDADWPYVYIKPGTTATFTAIVKKSGLEQRVEPASSTVTFGEGASMPGWKLDINGRKITVTVPSDAIKDKSYNAQITYTFEDGSTRNATLTVWVTDDQESLNEVMDGVENGTVTVVSSDNSGPAFDNCTEAHDAGVFDIPRDHKDYLDKLDRDQDGLACEPYGGGNDSDNSAGDAPSAPVENQASGTPMLANTGVSLVGLAGLAGLSLLGGAGVLRGRRSE